MKSIILYGAGENGRRALLYYGDEVAYFCDNNVQKHGQKICSIEVISFERMIQLYNQGFLIILTPENYYSMEADLMEKGIDNYLIYANHEKDLYINYLREKEIKSYEHNNQLYDYVIRSSKSNPLENVSSLKEVSKELLRRSEEEGYSLYLDKVGQEGELYGNLNNLLLYAGLKDDYDSSYSPFVSHQDCFPAYHVAYNSKHSYIVSGDYYKRKIHDVNSYIPVFSVGPYIHYATGIYSKEEVERIKNENGKTLLAYLPHGLENVQRKFSKKSFVDLLWNTYSHQFNTIMLCVYWADLNDPICDYAQEIGMKIVSNGLRFDEKFNCRQKSLLEIADAVVCGDIGTHIGFALYHGLPVSRIGITENSTIAESEFNVGTEKKLQLGDIYQKYKSDFYNIFNDEIQINENQKSWINPYQSFNRVKSTNEIRLIFKISKDIWGFADERTSKYPEAVFRTIRYYEENRKYDELILLRNALKNN